MPVTTLFDFCFAENGLTAYKLGQELPSNSFIKWIGESKYKELVNYILHYVADMDVPVKRGTFVEFRNGMINVSPVGRNASTQERNEFEQFDKVSGVRAKFVEDLKKKFPDIDLTYVFSAFLTAYNALLSLIAFMSTPFLVQILYWRPNLVRRLPSRLGQDLLPSSS